MSQFMGVSISTSDMIIMIAVSLFVTTLPAIILGYLGRFKTCLYVIFIWIAVPIALMLLLPISGHGPITRSDPQFLKEFYSALFKFERYSFHYVTGLLFGLYLGRNNKKWKLENKMPDYLIVPITALLPILWLFFIYGRIFM